jgi:hypothetical protein
MRPESFRTVTNRICINCEYYTDNPYTDACTLHGFDLTYEESYTCVCDDFEYTDGEGDEE